MDLDLLLMNPPYPNQQSVHLHHVIDTRLEMGRIAILRRSLCEPASLARRLIWTLTFVALICFDVAMGHTLQIVPYRE